MIEQSKKRALLYLFYWLSSFIIVFVAIKETADTNVLPALLGTFGGLFTFWRFFKRKKENTFGELLNVLKDDYDFDNYMFLKLSSIAYSISQGACLGAALGFFFDWIYALLNQQPYANSYLESIVFSIIALFAIRALLEISTSIFKTALDLRKNL